MDTPCSSAAVSISCLVNGSDGSFSLPSVGLGSQEGENQQQKKELLSFIKLKLQYVTFLWYEMDNL